jgi:hypothetical protein
MTTNNQGEGTMTVKAIISAAERFRNNPDDPRHGTENGYSNLKCKCEPCKQAWREAVAEDRKTRATKPVPDHVHGTENGYRNYGCKCDKCKTEWSRVSNRRRKRRDQRRREAAVTAR